MQVWRSRLQENGPHLVCGVLLALLGIDGARVIALSLHGTGTPAPPRSHPAATRASGVDLRSIVDAHLFGVAPLPSLDPDTAQPAAADLRLQGTFATADPRHGWAIIAADGAERLYAVGETAGGAALYSVYADHVLLDRGGQLESLRLPRVLAPHAVDVATATATATTAPAGPRRLGDIMRAQPALDEDSQHLIGFRLAPVAPASGLLKAGLRPYDLVTAVNGTVLTDQGRDKSRQILDSALASGSATLGILRGSVHLDVAVELPP